MNLMARLNSRFWRRKSDAVADAQIEIVAASGLDDLQARLNHWSPLWSAENESAAGSEAQQLVAERLTRWLERCFGQHSPRSLRGNAERISLASTTPICTAFLGRRATRELTRHVLEDI